MLMITSFANPRVAQAFVDYMATQGIILTIQQHAQSDVWLADESQAGRVRAELARFLENPADPRYLAASWQSGQTNSGLRYQRFPFFATLRHNAGPFTWAILLICIAVFILLWWWYLGGAVEKRIGSGKLVVITVISALLSGFVQHQFSGPWFGGLSGVVYALMGYVWLRGERDPQSGIYLQRGLILFSLVWLIAGWFDVFGMAIANGAHVAGLATGLAMAFVDTLHGRKRA